VVGPHDDADAGFPGGGEDFGARAFGVIGIFGVNMNDRAVIFVGTEVGERFAIAGELEARLVDGFEVLWIETLFGGEALLGLGDRKEWEAERKKQASARGIHGVKDSNKRFERE